jgi:hypothetical protein
LSRSDPNEAWAGLGRLAKLRRRTVAGTLSRRQTEVEMANMNPETGEPATADQIRTGFEAQNNVRFEDVLNAVKKAVEEGDVQGRSWAEIAAVKIAIDQTGEAKAVGEIVAILRKFEPKLQKMGIGTHKS